MEATARESYLAHYNLDQAKIDKMMDRAIQACLAYERGEMTLKQVWYRARGERFQYACQCYPDRELGGLLYELASDFFTEMGPMEYVIVDSILRVARAAKTRTSTVH